MSQFDEPTLDVPSTMSSEAKIKELAPDALAYLRSKKAEDLFEILGLDGFS